MARAGYQGLVQDARGNVVPNPSILVRRLSSGLPLAACYDAREGGSLLGNPFNGDADGTFTFYVEPGGAFRIVASAIVDGQAFQKVVEYAAIGTNAEFDFGTQFVPMGEWSNAVTYSIGQLVTKTNGGPPYSFVSIIDDNLNNAPLFDGTAPDLSDPNWQAIGLVESPGAPGSALMVGNTTTSINLGTVAIGDDVALTLTDTDPRGYGEGILLNVASAAAPETKYVQGRVVSYSHPTLTIDIVRIIGTGTFADGVTTVAGERGSSGISAGLPYVFDDTNTTTPAAGKISVSADDFSTLTDMSPGYVYIADNDDDGIDNSGFLLTIGDSTSQIKGELIFKRPDGNAKTIFKIVGAADHSGSRTRVPVSYLSGSVGMINAVDIALEWDLRGDAGSGAANFTELDDAPANYSGANNALVGVNSGATGVEFKTAAAVSVLGRSENSTGAHADIAAGANDRILARVGDALSFVQATFAMLASSALASASEVCSKAASKLVTAENYFAPLAPAVLSISSGNVAVNLATSRKFTLSFTAAAQLQLPTNCAVGDDYEIEVTASTGTPAWTWQSGHIGDDYTSGSLPTVNNVNTKRTRFLCTVKAVSGSTATSVQVLSIAAEA